MNKSYKALHLYQYARFNGKHVNFFAVGNPGYETLTITQVSEMLVSLKQGDEEIVVSWTNIAYAIPLTEATKAKKIENRGNLGDSQASSPKR